MACIGLSERLVPELQQISKPSLRRNRLGLTKRLPLLRMAMFKQLRVRTMVSCKREAGVVEVEEESSEVHPASVVDTGVVIEDSVVEASLPSFVFLVVLC